MNDIFDPGGSRDGRDDGMGRVEGNNPTFAYQFRHVILRLPLGWEGTCEDIREHWKGVKPKHHNAWGSCWGSAVRAGLLVQLEAQTHMRALKSHARKTHFHRRVHPSQAVIA